MYLTIEIMSPYNAIRKSLKPSYREAQDRMVLKAYLFRND